MLLMTEINNHPDKDIEISPMYFILLNATETLNLMVVTMGAFGLCYEEQFKVVI